MKKMPQFKSEAEERAFWTKADSTEYIDWEKAKKLDLALATRTLDQVTCQHKK